MQLSGKVALVTGASGDVGGAVAQRLGAAGALVVVGYAGSAPEAEATAAAITAAGGRARTLRFDQREPGDIDRCAADIGADHGRLDVLINNAAWNIGIEFPDLEGLDADLWDRIMETNLRGPYLLARACAPLLKADGGGHIVNITSVAGFAPLGSSIAYAVSKAALNHLTRCLAVAMAPEVAVNAVAPGLVENTRMAQRVPEAFRESIRKSALLGRTAQVDDIAAQVMGYLASTSITGQIMGIDGGLPMTMR